MRPVIPSRTSPALWCAPVIAVATFFAYWNHLGQGFGEATWASYLARASDGLNFGLPLSAGVAAWIGYRVRRNKFPRSFNAKRAVVRQFWAQTWLIFTAVAVGYAAIVVVQVAHRTPAPQLSGLEMLGTFLAMTLSAIGFGYIIGWFIPASIGVPLAIFVTYEWIAYPQLDSQNLSWRNITGYTLYSCCDVSIYRADPRAVVAPMLIGLAIGISVVAIVRFRYYALFPALVIVIGSVVAANFVVAGTQAQAQLARPESDETCLGHAPTVCLFPEQAQFGAQDVIRDAWENARRYGVRLPSRVVASASEGYSQLGTVHLNIPAGLDRPDTLRALAAATYDSLTCEQSPIKRGTTITPDMRTEYSLGLVLGGSPLEMMPHVIVSPDASEPGTALGEQEVRSKMKIDSTTAAARNVSEWMAGQKGCAK